MATADLSAAPVKTVTPQPAHCSDSDNPKIGEHCGVVLAGTHRWGGIQLDRFGLRSLLPVALRPLVVHSIDWLLLAGLQDVWICANSETSLIQSCLTAMGAPRRRLRYFEDVMPRGPAGCVRDTAQKTAANHLVVVEGSVIADFELQDLLETHCRENAALTIAIEEQPDAPRGQTEVPAGVYVFSRSILCAIPETGYQDLKEVLIPRLYEEGHRIAVHAVPNGSTSRVLDASSYLEANFRVVSRLGMQRKVWSGFARHGDAWVHETARVSPTAKLKGPVIIDRNTSVGQDVIIVGPSVIGRGAEIQAGAVVSRSILWKKCTVGRGVIVDYSLLTDNACVETTDVLREAVVCS